MAAQGLLDEMESLKGNQAGGALPALSQRHAYFFYAGILPALYNANRYVLLYCRHGKILTCRAIFKIS